MEAVITVFAVLFLLAVVVGVYATVKVVGAAKRSVDRGISQARRTVEDHTLRAKSIVQPGPAGELAELRLSLRTSMRATQDTLHARVAEDHSLKESLALFERLSAHGLELDAELRRLEAEPDRTRIAELLPAFRARTERITRSAEELRWAAHDRAHHLVDDDLEALSAEIDVEAGALRHWAPVDPATTPQPPPATHSGRQPGSRSGAPAEGHRRPQRPSSNADPRTPPAITPPGVRPAYPWQKKARPENTT
ncbi:hypothetical protein [Streptomyces tagetis]|uniref:Secreted protein n=1 Tax=Streptomyces tagetis TaxID=2820809 RepID=A0A940XPB1_9ACTN|nr:hypothetical protein [Streptomyces sp. RG38]MBQ0830747.1 hypothetical protein [Streptomyces sp. RG38]